MFRFSSLCNISPLSYIHLRRQSPAQNTKGRSKLSVSLRMSNLTIPNITNTGAVLFSNMDNPLCKLSVCHLRAEAELGSQMNTRSTDTTFLPVPLHRPLCKHAEKPAVMENVPCLMYLHMYITWRCVAYMTVYTRTGKTMITYSFRKWPLLRKTRTWKDDFKIDLRL